MQRNRALLGALLASLVLAAGVAGAFTTGTTSTAPTGTEHVSVDAAGQVEAQPDQAVVTVAVEATAADVATARNRLAANVSSVRTALTDAGVTDDGIETTSFDIRNVERRYEPRDDGGERQPEYLAVQRFTVTLSDPDRAGEIVDTAVDNGATRVDGVRLTLSRERRQELRQRALERAVDNARTEAETVAARAGLAVTGAHSISTTEVSSQPVRYEAARTTADAGGGTTIDSGPVTVSADVQVVYNATGQ